MYNCTKFLIKLYVMFIGNFCTVHYLFCIASILLIPFRPSFPTFAPYSFPSHPVPSSLFPIYPTRSHSIPFNLFLLICLICFHPTPSFPSICLCISSIVHFRFHLSLHPISHYQLMGLSPNRQSFAFWFDHFSSSSSPISSHNGVRMSKPAKLKVMVVITFRLWVCSLGQDAHCFISRIEVTSL